MFKLCRNTVPYLFVSYMFNKPPPNSAEFGTRKVDCRNSSSIVKKKKIRIRNNNIAAGIWIYTSKRKLCACFVSACML